MDRGDLEKKSAQQADRDNGDVTRILKRGTRSNTLSYVKTDYVMVLFRICAWVEEIRCGVGAAVSKEDDAF